MNSNNPDTKQPVQKTLTDRFFVFAGLSQLVGVFSVMYPQLFGLYLIFSLSILILLLIDRKSTLKPTNITAEFAVAHSPEIGNALELRFKIEIDTRTQSMGGRALDILAPPLETIRFEESKFPITLAKTKGHYVIEGSFKGVATKLGFEEIKAVPVRARSQWNLWVSHFNVFIMPTHFRVMPSNKKIAPEKFQKIIGGQRIFQQGNRRIMRGIVPEQFYTVRKYQYPDPLRTIDSKKTAKYQTPMTRVYDTTFQHHMVIGLDIGRGTLGRLGPSNKADYYLSAALALAESALAASDRVSFFAFSQKLHYALVNSKNITDFYPVFQGIEALKPLGVESNYELIPSALQQCAATRSIFVLLTDASRPSTQKALKKILPQIAAKHLVVVGSLIDETFSLEATLSQTIDKKLNFPDFNKILYQYWLNEQAQNFTSHINRFGAGYVSASENEWLNVVQRTYEVLRASTAI